MRGELDWIVMKALEKDRTRRYETANGLAADLRRYLDDEPVQAVPAVGAVPAAEVRPADTGRADRGGSGRGGAAGRGWACWPVRPRLDHPREEPTKEAVLLTRTSGRQANEAERRIAVAKRTQSRPRTAAAGLRQPGEQRLSRGPGRQRRPGRGPAPGLPGRSRAAGSGTTSIGCAASSVCFRGHRRTLRPRWGQSSNAWPSAPTARGSPPGPGIPSVLPRQPMRPRSGSGIRPPAASGSPWQATRHGPSLAISPDGTPDRRGGRVLRAEG